MYVIRLNPVVGEGGGYYVRLKHAKEQKNDFDYSEPVCENEITNKVKTWKTLTGVKRYAHKLVKHISEPIHLGSEDYLGAYRNRFGIFIIDTSIGISVYTVESNLFKY